MIGFVRGLLVTHVLAPQSNVLLEERRATLAGQDEELGTHAQEIAVLGLRTVPTGFEIGGGMSLEHRISVAVEVQHGDPAEAERLRDAITLDLCLRALDATDALANATDEETGQYVTALRWTVDYRPLVLDTPNENATIEFTIETQLDR